MTSDHMSDEAAEVSTPPWQQEHDAMPAHIQRLEGDLRSTKEEKERLLFLNARFKAFCERALDHCKNDGRGNLMVDVRIIERVEVEILRALGKMQ